MRTYAKPYIYSASQIDRLQVKGRQVVGTPRWRLSICISETIATLGEDERDR